MTQDQEEEHLMEEFSLALADPTVAPGEETSEPPPEEDAARTRIADLERELQELRDWALRIAADFENYKKRVERERQEHWRFAGERLLREMLPVMDNLQRAMKAAESTRGIQTLISGLEMVMGDFQKLLKRAGVEEIPAEGLPFDPAVHEALQQAESDVVEPGTVLEVHQPGYTMHGRVLRPSLVTVAVRPEVTSPGQSIPEEESPDS